MEEDEVKAGNRGRYLFIGLALLAVLAVYALRLADWQIRNGTYFLTRANSTSQFTVPMDTTRGQILDIKGNGLAINKVGYAIEFDKAYMESGMKTKPSTS